jgi:predicted regulator of Ras-like GTPase activity (Roadblock/LC7/MglB family)/Flp pilus assembly protein TadD
MSDDVRRMTAELAADPTSLVFLRLGEALRQAGRLEPAVKVTLQGLSRYPNLPEAHDLYARILVDQEDLESAFDEWDMTLRLDPSHGGAHKGLAFLFWKAGDLPSALRHLNAAAQDLPGDAQIDAALVKVQARLAAADQKVEAAGADVPTPSQVEPEPVLAEAPNIRFEVEQEAAATPATVPARAVSSDDILNDDGLLLVDAAGLRLLGTMARAGEGVADQVAAELAGVSREATRATKLLNLGEWKSIAVEARGANFILAPPTADTLLLIMRDATMPMGRVAIGSGRALEAARKWLEAAG